jgi:cell division transport system permease protein
MSAMGRRSALIPFTPASGIAMVMLVAAMAFLACFSLAGALGTTRVAGTWTEGLAGAATVRITATEDDRARRISLVLDILRDTEGVADARPLSERDVADLLTPWFGGTPELSELPTPSIVAVTLDPENEPDPSVVQARLDGAASGAIYDDHGRWRNRAAKAAHAVGNLSYWALGLTVVAIMSAVFLVVSIAMSAHRTTIEALRLAGAEDRFVAGLYQRRFFWLGAFGGLIGSGLALGAFVGLDALASVRAALPMLEAPYYWPFVWAGIVLVCAGLALLAARLAVLATLRRRA